LTSSPSNAGENLLMDALTRVRQHFSRDAMPKTFLSRTQAARRVGRCPRTMRNLAKRGEGPPFLLIGDRPAYPADSLDQWLTDNMHGAGQ
jgi:hypothetical protein